MLFNSFSFLFFFLPITAVVFFILAQRSRELAAGWLALASIFFYGWWSMAYIPLLLASIAFNYWAGWQIGHEEGPRRKHWLGFAITTDLALLAYFKYADFFITSVNTIARTEFPAIEVILPIGISFYTFTQIAFLVDTYRGYVKEYRFVHYLLFITYFPHLIAGPVLHHKEMMPQFGEVATYRFSVQNFAVGTSIFVIGLAKKVLIADNLAPHASFLFDQTESPSLFVAWAGVLAYTFQLYFDFSGYSDMAIGVSRIFGIKLPLNFDSPYKSANIIEFWRRWHMTLSRFLRDYLYISLGGNRHGPIRRYINLMLTMTLGGLWHGASWNFVIWGALHGIYLMINHAWIAMANSVGFSRRLKGGALFAPILTFMAVCTAWVFFRAIDSDRALTIIAGMYGVHGIGLPESLGMYLGSWRTRLENAGVFFYLGGGSRFLQTYAWVIVAAFIAFAFPNTQQIMHRFEPALDFRRQHGSQSNGFIQLAWHPGSRWAGALGLCFLFSLLSLTRPAEFLYFQF